MNDRIDLKNAFGSPDEKFLAAVRETLSGLPEHKRVKPRVRMRLAAAIAMAAILIAAAPFALSFRREAFVYDDVEYAGAGSVDFYISDYFGNAEKLTIPSVVSIACGVSGIGESAFRNKKSLSDVTIPDTVANIGSSAFSGCSNLKSLTIRTYDSSAEPYAGNGGTALLTIGDSAFSGCTALTEMRAGSVPPGISSPEGCSSAVCIPDGVAYIGRRAFAGCAGIASITLPGTLLSIGDEAFAGCDGLTDTVIPDSVTYIGENAFKNCGNIVLYVAAGSAAHRYAIGNNIRYEAGGSGNTLYRSGVFDYILTHAGTAVITRFYDDGSAPANVDIPGTLKGRPVTGIGDKAFVWSPGLAQVNIPAGVTHIGEAAFAGCPGLASAIIPESVTSIGKEAFAGCGLLEEILLPVNVTNIGQDAFKGCELLLLTVEEGSYPQRYAEDNGIPYRIRPTWL